MPSASPGPTDAVASPKVKVNHAFRSVPSDGLSPAGVVAACLTLPADNGVPDHIPCSRWSGLTNVKTTERWYVKPDVEDLREASTTWDGLHGASTQSCEKLRDVRPCRA
jgi:hypothetical protein